MQCPYCISEVDDEALACPHCTRDLYLVKSLRDKIDVLEARVRELEAGTPAADATEPVEPPPLPQAPYGTPLEWAALWLAPLLLLLIAHAAITVVLDLNTVYLRLVSLLIPLPFAVLLMQRQRTLPFWLVAGFVMALLAVLGMSKVIAMVDHTTVLPQDAREWREFIEYAASIGFSYATGIFLGRLLRQRTETLDMNAAKNLTTRVVTLLSRGKHHAERIQSTVEKVSELRTKLTALSTAALSAYTGLQSFFGQ